MAWRPGEWVSEGELDNTTPGWTTGWLKIEGLAEPLQLKLAGNCHPDLAGWKFRIVRTDPIPSREEPLEHADMINTDQSGHVGDLTAEQMLKHFECSVSEFLRPGKDRDMPPTTLRKSLYLEWFSNRNGRCVIQSTRLVVERLGERAFELTNEEWLEQANQNREEMTHFMYQLGDAIGLSDANDSDENENASDE